MAENIGPERKPHIGYGYLGGHRYGHCLGKKLAEANSYHGGHL